MSRMWDKIDAIPVQESENGKWGFILPDGTIALAEEYKSAPSVVFNGFYTVEENSGYSLYKFDAKKPELVKDAEGFSSIGVMEDGLIPTVRTGERITVINEKGEKAFTLDPVKGKEIKQCNFKFSDGMLMVRDEEDKYGFVDKSGQMVIDCKYDFVTDFIDGFAAAMIYDKDDSEKSKTMGLNKKGEEVFTLRASYDLVGIYSVPKIRVLVKDSNDHYILLDDKGEEIARFSNKVKRVVDVLTESIIYLTEDDQCGVMAYDGTEVIRPKYEYMQHISGDKFLAKASEDKYVILDDGNVKASTTDFTDIYYFGKFGFLGSEKKTACLLNDELKRPKGAVDFHDYYGSISHFGSIKSEFVNTAPVVSEVMNIVNDKGFGKYKIGEGPGKFFSEPRDYYYSYSTGLDDLKVEKKDKFNINATAKFNRRMADNRFNYDTFETEYYWNPDSKLESLELEISTEENWGNVGSVALVNALKGKGFTVIEEAKPSASKYVAGLKKGDIVVIVSSYKDSSRGTLEMGKYEASMDARLKRQIEDQAAEDSRSYSSSYDYDDYGDYAVAGDSVATDTVEEAWVYDYAEPEPVAEDYWY